MAPRSRAALSVSRMPAGSPAWNPQATLALLTMSSMAASSPMRHPPRLSPRSLFRSIFIVLSSPDSVHRLSVQLAGVFLQILGHGQGRANGLAHGSHLVGQAHAGHARLARCLLGQGRHVDEAARSEEHTSELQSPCNLVCRLLLEQTNIRLRTLTL